jgi:hypothetical protein
VAKSLSTLIEIENPAVNFIDVSFPVFIVSLMTLLDTMHC